MKLQTILGIISSYDKENVRVELKESSKFLTSEGKFDGKEMASIIVAFANREGGLLIVGVKDDGSFEGGEVFSKYSDHGKTGFDKFKEYIENICKDVISPQIFVESHLFKYNHDEFGVISIPKRLTIPHAVVSKHEGSIVRTREYYIRTTHGKALVSDRHLEWLFSHVDLPKIKSECVLELSVLRDQIHVPERLGSFERFATQPSAYKALNNYFDLLTDEGKQKLRKHFLDRERFFREVLIYAIVQSIDYQSDHLKALPIPTEKMIMHEYLGDAVKNLIHQKENLWSVPFGTSMKIKSYKDSTILKFGNKSILGMMTLQMADHSSGLSEINPYAHIFNDNNELETFTFICQYQVELKYPEDFDESYEEMLRFASSLEQTLREKWDIVEHFNGMPHYKLLYEIDYKLNKLLEKKSTKTEKK